MWQNQCQAHPSLFLHAHSVLSPLSSDMRRSDLTSEGGSVERGDVPTFRTPYSHLLEIEDAMCPKKGIFRIRQLALFLDLGRVPYCQTLWESIFVLCVLCCPPQNKLSGKLSQTQKIFFRSGDFDRRLIIYRAKSGGKKRSVFVVYSFFFGPLLLLSFHFWNYTVRCRLSHPIYSNE